MSDEERPNFEPGSSPADWVRDPFPGLAEALSAGRWLTREVPPVDHLLGDFLTTTTRAFLVGRTGLGKTMLGMGIAMGMATGTGFLHWKADRPSRGIYIDGEMPGELLTKRIQDATRRVTQHRDRVERTRMTDLIHMNFLAYSTEDSEQLAGLFPALGRFEPLNTEAGQEFIRTLCAALKPDWIIFDNLQCLVAGVQKEEETWLGTLPLVQWLTSRRIGQLWFDHANGQDRQYGSMTKSWRFDAVGIMTPLPDDQQDPEEMAFRLSFDPPHGKARRKMPSNWRDFAPQIVRLRDDGWTSEPEQKAPAPNGLPKNDEAQALYRVISNLFAAGHGTDRSPEPDMPPVPAIPKALLVETLIRKGWFRLTGKDPDHGGGCSTVSDKVSVPETEEDKVPRAEHTRLWKRLDALEKLGLIGFNRELVWLAKGHH